MTRAEAGRLFALLTANYPRTKIPDETAELWLDELAKLEQPIGEEAVRSVVASVKTWPSIAHMLELAAVAREQAAREQATRERIEAELAYELLPRPLLREIPAVVDALDRWHVPLPVERADDGPCDDDCGREGERYRVGKVSVCAVCARRRMRVAANVDANGEAA